MIKPISNGMKWLFLVAGFLVLLAGFQLFILTEYTDQYFAWTIQPFITAAFLGGGYFSSFLMEFLASRRTRWVEARVAVPAVFTFTTLTLIATLLHLDRFHFSSPGQLAQAAAWFWIGIYVIVPPAMLVMWYRQYHFPGDDPKRSTPLPTNLRILLIIEAIAMLVWGITLFADPAAFSASWPWKLTPLTSQAVGAWLIALGVFAVHATAENDYARIRIGAISYFFFGSFGIITLLRYPASFSWMTWSGWFYVALIASVLLTGLYSTNHVWKLGGTQLRGIPGQTKPLAGSVSQQNS